MEYVLGNFQQAKWRKWLPKHVGKMGCGCIYAIEYKKGFIKIGSTKNPWNRFSCLEREKNYVGDNYAPKRFMLSNPFVGYKEFESVIHKHFSSVREKRTELFEVDLMFAVRIIESLADKANINFEKFENGINNLTPCDTAIISAFLGRRKNV